MRGRSIATPNMNAVTRNLPGSGNLSDLQIIIPNKIGGKIVAKYKNVGLLNIFKSLFEEQFHNFLFLYA